LSKPTRLEEQKIILKLFKLVNERIARGENKYVKLKAAGEKRCWSLIYPIEEEPINSSFYSQLPGIGIANLLWFVATKTGFLRAFTHVLDRYVKQSPDPREIFACIVAMGTNMGLWKMAEVSGLSYDSLLTTARNFLRLETVHAGNDAICNATAALPAFHHYDIYDELHSSSDGQRFETQINTINARYSRKYFTLKKGVSAYTLVLNHAPINAKVIGTHEHESHYVYDLLHNNTMTSNQNAIRPIRMAPIRLTSGFCMYSVIASRHATATCTKEWIHWSGSCIRITIRISLSSPCARYSTR
jgi:hypothetical protein